MSEITAYHGTFIDPEDIEDIENPIFTPDGSYSDMGVYWVCNEHDDVVFFTDWNGPNDNCLRVIMKGVVDTSRHYETENDGHAEIDGVEYFMPTEREEAYEAARRAGYTGVNIPGNYENGGDDIALLEDGEFQVQEFSFFIDGEWTEFMEWGEAEDLVREKFSLNEAALIL